MRGFSASLCAMLISLYRNRDLILASVRREVLGRYRGSAMGLLWSFVYPFLMLVVFTFMFSVVFQSRWGSDTESTVAFAMVLFPGLMVFNLFAECLTRAPGLIVSHPNYVKKLVFPLEILPAVSVLSALFHLLASLSVWFLAYSFFFGLPHFTVLLFPFIMIPFIMFTMGLSWGLASLGVYLRDVAQIIGVLTSVLMFLSPIFYPVSAFPEAYRYLLYLNPLSPVIEMTRDVLYWGRIPNIPFLGAYWVATFVIAWLGFAWFQKTRKGFADVL
jgi:lipopolysaccharide transport system permease protein